MDESQGEEGADPEGMTSSGTEQLQSNPEYGSRDESPDAAGGTSEGPAGSRDNSPDHTQASNFDGVLCYIHELQESQRQLEECFESLRAIYQDYCLILEALEEEQSRLEYLEERLNDLIDLCQKEIWNLKEELATTEQKIADRAYDTTQDYYAVLQTCETHLFQLEQQQQRKEEKMQPERWINTVHHVLGELMNVPLAIMAVLLVLISTWLAVWSCL